MKENLWLHCCYCLSAIGLLFVGYLVVKEICKYKTEIKKMKHEETLLDKRFSHDEIMINKKNEHEIKKN